MNTCNISYKAIDATNDSDKSVSGRTNFIESTGFFFSGLQTRSLKGDTHTQDSTLKLF